MSSRDQSTAGAADEPETAGERPAITPTTASLRFSGAVISREAMPDAGRILKQLASEISPLANLAPQVHEAIQRINQQLAVVIEQMRRPVSFPLLQNPALQQAIASMIASLRRYWPPNWDDTSIHDFDAVLAVAQEGIPLVWVPRAELVAQLLAAPDAPSRRALLAAHVEEIIADCAAVVAEVDHPRLLLHRARLADAVAAHRAGLHAPGQAMAAVVVTALLQWVYGHSELKKVRRSPMRAKDEEEQLIRDLKVALLIEAAVPAAAGGMDRLGDDELPDGFNRHATLHRVADRAYTLPNAMSALMLATGLLAEAQQLLEDRRLMQPESARGAAGSTGR